MCVDILINDIPTRPKNRWLLCGNIESINYTPTRSENRFSVCKNTKNTNDTLPKNRSIASGNTINTLTRPNERPLARGNTNNINYTRKTGCWCVETLTIQTTHLQDPSLNIESLVTHYFISTFQYLDTLSWMLQACAFLPHAMVANVQWCWKSKTSD